MQKQLDISLKLTAKSKKTRSQPPDKDDPYKMDLLQQELTVKYQQMLKGDGEQMKIELGKKGEYDILKKEQQYKEEDAPKEDGLYKLLKGIDADMDQDLLMRIMSQAKNIAKDV